MIHEIRTYSLVPGGVREYLRHYNAAGRAVQTELLGHLVAVLAPESGDINQLVYHWCFDSFEERSRRRAALLADERFTAFRQLVRHLLVHQESRLFSPV
ncbi:MAG: NIPSNAP family protein [Pseudomonadota bacterium]|nr:NIPSNAP family protein [Pseudomonadota bacterium]